MSTNMYTSSRMNTFETNNRRLEQFLFVHDIRFKEWYKNDDGMTTWVYPDNSEVREVVQEFRKLDARRRDRRLNESVSSFQSSYTHYPNTQTPARQTKYGPIRENYPNPRDFKRC